MGRTFSYDYYDPFNFLNNILDSIESNNFGNIPTDIIKFDDEHYEIRLAVSGRKPSDFTVEQDKRLLTIKCDKTEEKETKDGKNPIYLSNGIMKRAFTVKFTLDEFMFVDGVDYKDGILIVKIRKELPENLKPKIFRIGEDKNA